MLPSANIYNTIENAQHQNLKKNKKITNKIYFKT